MPEQSAFEESPLKVQSSPSNTTQQTVRVTEDTQGPALTQGIPEEEENTSAQIAPPSEDFEAGVLAQLDSLYRTALRMTNNRQEAEDLVQETMLKAFRFAHSYQPGTNLRAWLFRILNTSAINRYRKQAAHPTPSPLPDGEEFYLYNQIRDLSGRELSAGAEEEVLSKYLDEDVFKALNDLPPNFRMAVVLADIEGLSYKEIAEALQIPIGTVMSRISRARRQLQQSLWKYAQDKGYVKAEAS
ncbi:MAG: sigma-70 family RNA polymerase sigma factor [Ktedonobacteraceae bacterium]